MITDISRAAVTLLWALLVWLCTGATVAGEISPGAEPGTQIPTGLATELDDALTAQGWIRVKEADGSLIYRAPAIEGPWATAPVERSDDEAPADYLRTLLEAYGWTAAPAEDGGIYYRPPGVSGPPAAAPDASEQGQTETGSLADRLRQTLEAQGWTAAPAEDGGVYYLPPTPSVGTSEKGVGTYEPTGEAVGGGVSADEQGPSPAPAADAVAPSDQARSPSETAPAPEPMGPEERQPGGSPSSMKDATQPDYPYPSYWQLRGVPRFHMGDRAWPPVMRQHPLPAWRPSPWRAPPPGGAYPYR